MGTIEASQGRGPTPTNTRAKMKLEILPYDGDITVKVAGEKTIRQGRGIQIVARNDAALQNATQDSLIYIHT